VSDLKVLIIQIKRKQHLISVIKLPYFLDLRASGGVLRFYWSMPFQMTAFTNKILERQHPLKLLTRRKKKKRLALIQVF